MARYNIIDGFRVYETDDPELVIQRDGHTLDEPSKVAIPVEKLAELLDVPWIRKRIEQVWAERKRSK